MQLLVNDDNRINVNKTIVAQNDDGSEVTVLTFNTSIVKDSMVQTYMKVEDQEIYNTYMADLQPQIDAYLAEVKAKCIELNVALLGV